jgi:DNA-binding NarL/FixJ family response regulator
MVRKLLALVEFMGHARLPALYRQLGFEVTTEFQARKAVSRVRSLKPDVIVADFYFQADFRDRLSNLESLLAAAQPLADTRILVLYEPGSEAALTQVRARLRIDAALPVPVNEAALSAVLEAWR